tara:strand:- start:5289 stop:6317 length:1029 start_codon:yes stop_codon:yes gene_type:complete
MHFETLKNKISQDKKKWLITGVAGFIGSNLLEVLLDLNQDVVGVDNFSTGHKYNLNEVESNVGKDKWSNFKFIEGDIIDFSTCKAAVKNVNYVLHQAALGSVPRSIEDPISTNQSNISGFLNILEASKNEKVDSFTYAASSSTYGDHEALPKLEDVIGKPLSPYAVTKYVNELYATVYANAYGFKSIGLRYFNVFGKRQDPDGAYAAVIPKWISLMVKNNEVTINGDGETSRDFCYIDNVVQVNLLSAIANEIAKDNIYNVALGDKTSLNELHELLKKSLTENDIKVNKDPSYIDFRAGDVRHSQADISKAKNLLNYNPTHDIDDGIKDAMAWYIDFMKKRD